MTMAKDKPPTNRRPKAIRRPAVPKPRKSTYVPPGCWACKAGRPRNADTGKIENYTRVEQTIQYTTSTLRWLRCKFCNNKWYDREPKIVKKEKPDEVE